MSGLHLQLGVGQDGEAWEGLYAFLIFLQPVSPVKVHVVCVPLSGLTAPGSTTMCGGCCKSEAQRSPSQTLSPHRRFGCEGLPPQHCNFCFPSSMTTPETPTPGRNAEPKVPWLVVSHLKDERSKVSGGRVGTGISSQLHTTDCTPTCIYILKYIEILIVYNTHSIA